MSSSVSHGWTAEQIARSLEKPQRTPTGWKACCPAHEDRNPSLYLADGSRGGIAMVCYAGCTYADIVSALSLKGIDLSGRTDDPREIPDDHYQLGRPHSSWDYRDQRGAVVMRVCRWEQPGGKKEIRPLIRTADGWKWAHHPTPRPLYARDRLASEPDCEVLVVEGEKAAAAAQRMLPEFVVTTWPGGAQSVGQSDWSVLAGRKVTLIPDCDAPGRKAMEWVTRALGASAASLRTIDPANFVKDLPEGWDLADAATESRDVRPWLQRDPEKEISYPITLRPIHEIVAEQREPEWLIDDVIEQNVLAVLAGARGTFKSFVSLDWNMRIAMSGRPVVILSGEGAGLDRRVDAWMRTHGGARCLENVPVFALERAVNLNAESDLLHLREAIGRLDEVPAMITIDTFSKFSAGLDENDNGEVSTYLAAITHSLREMFRTTVLLVAHSGHGDASRPRGASALMANPDAEYIVSRPAPTAMSVTVTRQRFKDCPSLDPLAYEAQVVDLGRFDKRGRPVTSLALVSAEMQIVAPKARGANQDRAMVVLREYHRAQPDATHISSIDLAEMLKTQGISRKRRPEVLNWLVNARILTPSIGGFSFDPKCL